MEQSSILDSDVLEFRIKVAYFLHQSSEPVSEIDLPSVCGNCMKEELPRCTGCSLRKILL